MTARRGKSKKQNSANFGRALPDESPSAVETEVKFVSCPEEFQLAFDSPLLGGGLKARTQSMRSVYFDTPQSVLMKHGIALRLRKSAGTPLLMTLKLPGAEHGGPFRRREYEVRVISMVPNLGLFEPKLAEYLQHLTAGQPLDAQFETRVMRRTRQLDVKGAAIEVAFDKGKIVTTGGAELAICEVELELKSGAADKLYDFAAGAAENLPLRLDVVPKSEKGYKLSSGENPAAVKAKAIELNCSTTLDELIASVLTANLTQFTANWAPLLETDAAEPIHQLRVSLRRLRGACKILGWSLDSKCLETPRSEAKRIATALGEARALDVLQLELGRMRVDGALRPLGCDELLARLQQRRTQAYQEARALITGTATTLFVLRLQSMIASHGWRDCLAPAEVEKLSQSARDFAIDALDRLLTRARKRGRRLRDRTDEERHALRIAIKDLRYGIDFFGGFFGRPKQAGAYLSLLGNLQDLLGAHNDAVTTAMLLWEIAAGCEPEIVHAAGYIAGWQARGKSLDTDALDRTWREFKAMKPFWR